MNSEGVEELLSSHSTVPEQQQQEQQQNITRQPTWRARYERVRNSTVLNYLLLWSIINTQFTFVERLFLLREKIETQEFETYSPDFTLTQQLPQEDHVSQEWLLTVSPNAISTLYDQYEAVEYKAKIFKYRCAVLMYRAFLARRQNQLDEIGTTLSMDTFASDLGHNDVIRYNKNYYILRLGQKLHTVISFYNDPMLLFSSALQDIDFGKVQLRDLNIVFGE